MSGRPRGFYPKSWEVFVLPSQERVEFAIFPNTTGLKYSYDLASEHRRAGSLGELDEQIANLPKTRWVSFQYYDAALPEPEARTLQAELEQVCDRYRRRCVFAL